MEKEIAALEAKYEQLLRPLIEEVAFLSPLLSSLLPFSFPFFLPFSFCFSSFLSLSPSLFPPLVVTRLTVSRPPQRTKVLNGEREPSAEELSGFVAPEGAEEGTGCAAGDDSVKGVPEFWLHALLNCAPVVEMGEIMEADHPCLRALRNIEVQPLDSKKSVEDGNVVTDVSLSFSLSPLLFPLSFSVSFPSFSLTSSPLSLLPLFRWCPVAFLTLCYPFVLHLLPVPVAKCVPFSSIHPPIHPSIIHSFIQSVNHSITINQSTHVPTECVC